MNKRLEVTLEFVVNGRQFTMALPYGAPYDDALTAGSAFIDEINSMKSLAAQQAEQAAAAQAPSA